MKMHAQCICNMLTWLPTKVPMPTASSIDLVLVGIHNIFNTLQNLSASSPLAPLTDSQGTMLQQLMVILHGTTKSNMLPLPVLAPTVSALRVPTIITVPAIPLRVTPATPPDMADSPRDNLLPKLGPHLIMDDHIVVPLTNAVVLVTDLATCPHCLTIYTSSLMIMTTPLHPPAIAAPNARHKHVCQLTPTPQSNHTGLHAYMPPTTANTLHSMAMLSTQTWARLQNTAP